MKKLLSLALAAVLVFSLVACGKKTDDKKPKDEGKKAQATVLKGSAKGYAGDVTVEVTKDGDKITKVVAKGEKETKEIGVKALDELTKKIIEKGTVEGVDAIAGATVTSNALFKAIKEAK